MAKVYYRTFPSILCLAHNPVLPTTTTIKKLIFLIAFILLLIIGHGYVQALAPYPTNDTAFTPLKKVPKKHYKVVNQVLAETCSKYIPKLEQYPWDTRIILEIAKAESRCNPNAINHADKHKNCMGSYSLLQVGCLHYKAGQDKTDVDLNIKIAYQVYKEAGYSFRPWTTCKLVKNCR